MRAPVFVAAASVIASITILQTPADAQVRVARPRPVVAVRPAVVSRPTVFIGGYYYPDPEKTAAVMRPSKTFNEALEAVRA